MNLSIITISLNSASVIEKAITSVRSQSCRDTEHIIIDGGSTDGTLDILDRYADGISYFISERDAGIYNAMNKGIKVSTGDVLFFLNSDDYFADDKVVEDVLQGFNKQPELDVVFGNQIFDCSTKMIVKDQSFHISRNQLARITIQHQTIFAKKHLFELTNGFSEAYRIVSDYDWILKVFLVFNCNYLHLNRNISVMSTKGLSWTSNYERERLRVMKNYFTNYEILRYRIIPRNSVSVKNWFNRLIPHPTFH